MSGLKRSEYLSSITMATETKLLFVCTCVCGLVPWFTPGLRFLHYVLYITNSLMLLGTSKKSVSIMDISNNGILMQDGKARICRDSEKTLDHKNSL